MKMNKVSAILLAAGQGKRMNTAVAKQFITLKEKPILYYSLKVLEESDVDEIVLVTGEEHVAYCKEQIIELYKFRKVRNIVIGGKERYDSVYRGLLELEDTDYVLIHDGARPFITAKLINTVIENVKEYDACIVGVPVKDTIKVINNEGFIINTPNREQLWSAQTPQAFEYLSIKNAYDMFYEDTSTNRNRNGITDDGMVYDYYIKRPVKMVPGGYQNIKITTKEDLSMAEVLLGEQNVLESDKMDNNS